MTTALDIFLRKHPTPAGMAEKDALAATVIEREQAFFVSGVEDVRAAQRLSDFIRDFLAGAVDVLPDGRKVLRVQGKADFVAKARDFMVSEGLVSPEDRSDAKYNSNVRNVGSLARLRLVFDVQVRKCFEYARWEKGWDADLLDSFPAARFVRYSGAKEPRVKHVANEGAVRLKADFAFWAEDMNSLDIGGFLTPWGPYGFNSFMSQEDVSKGEAIKQGLIAKGSPTQPPDLTRYGMDVPERMTKGTRASLDGLDDQHVQALIERVRKRYGQANIDKRNGVEFPYLKAAQMARGEAARKASFVKQGAESLVGDKIAVSGRDEAKVDVVKEAISVIDGVHRDGPLNNIELNIKNDRILGDGSAGFVHSLNTMDKSQDMILVRPSSREMMIDTVHEIGHFIDLRGISGEGWATDGSMFHSFMRAFKDSRAYTRIKEKCYLRGSIMYWEYAAKSKEVFARAYSQYIMEKSQNPRMLAEYEAFKSDTKATFTLWDHDDFKPIMNELDIIFKELKWL